MTPSNIANTGVIIIAAGINTRYGNTLCVHVRCSTGKWIYRPSFDDVLSISGSSTPNTYEIINNNNHATDMIIEFLFIYVGKNTSISPERLKSTGMILSVDAFNGNTAPHIENIVMPEHKLTST